MLGSAGLMGRLRHYHGNPDIDQQLPSYLRHRLTQDRVDLSFSYPLLLSSTRSLMASAGIYGSNQSDNYFNRINGASLVLKTDVRVLHAEVDFTQAATKRTRKLGFGIAQGLDMWGAGATSTTNIPGAIVLNPTDVRFTRYNLNTMQADTWVAHVGTVVSLVGQYSHYRLPTIEQISFGGPRFGLGYDRSGRGLRRQRLGRGAGGQPAIHRQRQMGEDPHALRARTDRPRLRQRQPPAHRFARHRGTRPAPHR